MLFKFALPSPTAFDNRHSSQREHLLLRARLPGVHSRRRPTRAVPSPQLHGGPPSYRALKRQDRCLQSSATEGRTRGVDRDSPWPQC